ncbi:alpha-L-fucosidase [Tessaracoccus rhinocerotis]|uniref:alpha-L-fucosidase n=1 Tax=Tessaracoccus rhinocerotis TaxID=1689449 RepID=UPI001FE9E6B2|nr:alpha-L-fucosidase [Tessaracoccus rhinocerotis]
MRRGGGDVGEERPPVTLAQPGHGLRHDTDVHLVVAPARGARYVFPTTKHHDGFCLWDTATTRFRTAHRGPKHDLIAEIHDAVRAAGARFGVYFSGALDWHVSDLPPIQSDRDLFTLRRNDAEFSRYSTAQLDELIERFQPEVLWNDIEWPDGGKGGEDYALAAVFREYLRQVPDGVVNDRWGVPAHGFLTRVSWLGGEDTPVVDRWTDVPDGLRSAPVAVAAVALP